MSYFMNNRSQTFESHESNSLGKAWYVREGFPVVINCFAGLIDEPGAYLKYRGAIFEWGYKGKKDPILETGRTLYGNGTVEYSSVSKLDSGTLYCTAEKLDGTSKDTFTHSLIVYTIAQFFLTYPFVYTVPICDSRANNKQSDIMKRLCASYGPSRDDCPFSARMECFSKINKHGASDGYRLRIHIEQRLERNFRAPNCDAKCIKKAIYNQLTTSGDDIVKKVIDYELSNNNINNNNNNNNNSNNEASNKNRNQNNNNNNNNNNNDNNKTISQSIYIGYVFDSEELMHKSTLIRCPNGHQIYMQVLCVPCFPGFFAFYDSRFTDKNFPNECEPCDYGFYQEQFSMDTCYKCPDFGITVKRGSSDSKDCISRHLSSIELYLAAAAVLVLGLSISLLCMAQFGINVLRERNKEKLLAAGVDIRSGYPGLGFRAPLQPPQPQQAAAFLATNNSAISPLANNKSIKTSGRPTAINSTKLTSQPTSELTSELQKNYSNNLKRRHLVDKNVSTTPRPPFKVCEQVCKKKSIKESIDNGHSSSNSRQSRSILTDHPSKNEYSLIRQKEHESFVVFDRSSGTTKPGNDGYSNSNQNESNENSISDEEENVQLLSHPNSTSVSLGSLELSHSKEEDKVSASGEGEDSEGCERSASCSIHLENYETPSEY
ncbi:hypothetical protein HELRODRAFT_191657 [Helobdella robusta]|uniref:Tyrosine-protein kinase ephrin type A/B receptor-like domain-containing protein n=1 Tax=Helobdella robusta TaxID=6412 RepID=T1FT66_HELRO|nr:hypothetical protein HELRODRAFT_191657 [Helobdella robusta]ESO04625.1 hypothetical protein HELRODRAFT_191657 [Helobdella robusta]